MINEEVVKVWTGNESCSDISWEDCILEDRVVKEARGDLVCTQSNEMKCTEVECEE